jgi:hypothetical protein
MYLEEIKKKTESEKIAQIQKQSENHKKKEEGILEVFVSNFL